ncbi:ROK family protein [Microbacterium terrisoli]|uniref:ROK family protein n=1 Tax=Microbacterium terrisoli TaxID=3242192 RepID=UPI002803F3C6|nr:ROK family protein [Microbacterium protaetiae]
MADRAQIAGIDIGGTKIAAILTTGDGSVTARGVASTPARAGGDAIVDAAARLVAELSRVHDVRVAAAGVGTAGVVDHSDGVVVAASQTFSGWAGYRLGDVLSTRLGVPVHVENDVNAFLVGESAWGASPARDVLGVMLGTGVGGALLLDGVLRHGPHGGAGEIGHTPGYGDIRCTCGQTGHLETVASGTSIGLRYGERTGHVNIGAHEVAERARSGDGDARAVFDSAGRALALACATAAGIVDVSVAVIGGGVTRSWDLLAPAIERTLATDSPVSGADLRIVRGTLGGSAVALGAAHSARQAMSGR